jgi:signal peptidase II
MTRRLFVWAAIIALFLDQVTKIMVYGMLEPGESTRLIGNVLRVVRASNDHGVFGINYGPRLLYFLLPLVGAVLVVWFAWRTRDRWSAAAFGIILGGALGNLVDRVRLGGNVIDFIDVGLRGWRWYTFNVADSCVVVGVIMLLGREFLFPAKPAPAPAAAEPNPSATDLPRQ